MPHAYSPSSKIANSENFKMSQKQVPKPRALFAFEDDGLIQRLDFSDSEDEENHKLDTSNGFIEFEEFSSPIITRRDIRNRKIKRSDNSSPSEFNSSCDSVMDSENINEPKLRKRLVFEETATSKIDLTPPYRRVRALRLFGSPQSPKTLLKQSELSSIDNKKIALSRIRVLGQEIFDKNHNVQSRVRPLSWCKYSSSALRTNINPFCKSDEYSGSTGKRRRDSGICGTPFNESFDSNSENEFDRDFHPNKRLKERTLSRYESEFLELGQIGSGEFGSVWKCINRLDGCVYAIKKSRKPLKGTSDERTALNEVYAHAVLGHHKHVVRYYSAWAENDHMLIQNEYCNGGSLAQLIEEKALQNTYIPESEVKHILIHIVLGLRYIHSLNLAHMDIKPGNIFITRKKRPFPVSPQSSDDGFEEDELEEDDLVYKIGDLGHVTSLTNPEVEEGDCRYLPAELLRDDYSHLPKADIFALGLTMFEVCGGGPLPKNGEEWHTIRKGNLPYLSYYSKELNELIRQMVHPDPKVRPTSAALVHNQTLVPYVCKTKEQLNRELNEEKFKNQLLSRQLVEMARVSSSENATSMDNRENKMLIGVALKDSNSASMDQRKSKMIVGVASKDSFYSSIPVGIDRVGVAKSKCCTRLIGKGINRSNSITF